MTRGRAATSEPFDLGAVAGTDELLEALSTRRLAELSTGRTADDPAVDLLAALVADVDVGAPPLPAPARASCGMPSGRRRSVRAFVAFGVAALVLTSAGAAAAGGGNGGDAMRYTHGPARTRGPERSNANAQRQSPAIQTPVTARLPAARHLIDAHREAPVTPKDDPKRLPDDLQSDHHGHKQSRTSPHTPPVTADPTPDPGRPSWGPIDPTTPTPTPAVPSAAP